MTNCTKCWSAVGPNPCTTVPTQLCDGTTWSTYSPFNIIDKHQNGFTIKLEMTQFDHLKKHTIIYFQPNLDTYVYRERRRILWWLHWVRMPWEALLQIWQQLCKGPDLDSSSTRKWIWPKSFLVLLRCWGRPHLEAVSREYCLLFNIWCSGIYFFCPISLQKTFWRRFSLRLSLRSKAKVMITSKIPEFI